MTGIFEAVAEAPLTDLDVTVNVNVSLGVSVPSGIVSSFVIFAVAGLASVPGE